VTKQGGAIATAYSVGRGGPTINLPCGQAPPRKNTSARTDGIVDGADALCIHLQRDRLRVERLSYSVWGVSSKGSWPAHRHKTGHALGRKATKFDAFIQLFGAVAAAAAQKGPPPRTFLASPYERATRNRPVSVGNATQAVDKHGGPGLRSRVGRKSTIFSSPARIPVSDLNKHCEGDTLPRARKDAAPL
jgi:hypothetical protein